MWFNKKKQKAAKKNTEQTLTSILSNGIELSIDELIQYQTKTSLINLAASKDLHGKMSGNYLARSKGRGMEFDEVRHYQNGDDIRAIDWRVTARTGITHTKVFREEVERPVLIATDLTSNMLFGSQLLFKSIQAAHLAALVAWHARSRGDRVGGIVFDQYRHQELKPRSRQQGVLHYLHALVKSHQNSLLNLTSIDDKPISLDTIFEQNKIDFVNNHACKEFRFEQAWQEVFGIENEKMEPTIKAMGDFLRFVIRDVMKEESDIMEENSLSPKVVNSMISRVARGWFSSKLDEEAGLS